LSSEQHILTVGEITRSIKDILEESFDDVLIIGEISNYKNHYSGHWYFSLKDSDAQINCVMWRSLTQQVFFSPNDGMKVVVRGKLTVYPPRGNYQIDVRSMQPAGVGELQLAFEKLKQKLFDEGLFAEEKKRPIPVMPSVIGVATSVDGAAFRDMISVARRRYPLAEIVISPCKVQGAGAAETIVEAIKQLQDETNADVIIVGRGGGSIEDLWAFNEEIVARAIADCKIPVISGVGHEIDFTIADFVADLRAPTPTAAMELATPDKAMIVDALDKFQTELDAQMSGLIQQLKQDMNEYSPEALLRRPAQTLSVNFQRLDYTSYKLHSAMDKCYLYYKNTINLLQSALQANDVNKTLKKGFVLVRQQGKFVKKSVELHPDSDFEIIFSDKTISAKQR
jgi:exodeoxyribonuclease VII large subunit